MPNIQITEMKTFDRNTNSVFLSESDSKYAMVGSQ